MQGYATRRQAIAGVLAQRGVCAGTDAGRTWAAEGHGRRLIFCETQNRTDPISGFAKNGDASVQSLCVLKRLKSPSRCFCRMIIR